MPTPAEIRESLKQRLDALNTSLTVAADIAGTTVSQLSRFLNGTTGTDFKDLQRIHRVVSAMEMLADQASPLPIDFRNTAKIRELISKIQKDNLKILILDFAEQRPTSADYKHGVQALLGQVEANQ
jgi:methylphosphotriester-DNA--protein-cysteine methyltransferase